MKKVLVDARMVTSVGHGIGNYVTEIAQSLLTTTKSYELEFLVSPQLSADHPLRQFRCVETDISFLHPRETLSLGKVIQAAKPDLYHSPSFSSLLSYPCPHVQTVHDLNHLRFGSFLQKAYYRTLLLPSIKSAKALITVSLSAKEEIQSWLLRQNIQKEIFIAKNVIAPSPLGEDPHILKKLGIEPKNYFFALSNAKPHKNLDFLEQAHASRTVKHLPLVLSTPGTSPTAIHAGHLKPEELNALLRQAKVLFSPSLYEGFGRPPLEAALAGVKPIVSDIAPHREGLRGVSEAEFLDPNDLVSWQTAFFYWTHNTPEEVSAESKKWIESEYSLKNLGASMNEVYSRALNQESAP